MIDIVSNADSISNRYGSSFFYKFVYVALIFGVILYDTIGFNFVDEALAGILLLYCLGGILSFRIKNIKSILLLLIISLFYLIYSYKIHSNSLTAILNDYITQVKPYLGYFCTLLLSPMLDDDQKQSLKKLCFIIWFYLLIIGLLELLGVIYIYDVFGHYSRYATSAVAVSLLYLSISDFNNKTVRNAIILCSVGLFSMRAKFYGFFCLEFLLLVALLYFDKIKLNIKTLIYSSLALAVIILSAWSKIDYYFIQGAFESEDAFARPFLYIVGYQIMFDYFPFGSGLASFATYFSGQYYSSIYEKYGIENVYGITEDSPDFIADTFYPSLAQYGVFGSILFFMFWLTIVVKSVKAYTKIAYEHRSYIAILLLGTFFFLIECTSDTTLTHNRGFFILIIMGYSMSSLQNILQKNENVITD